MKKLLTIVCAVMAVLVMAACSSNSPKATAEKAVKCIIDKDYKGYVDLLYFDTKKDSPEEIAKTKEGFVQMLEEKGSKTIEKKGEVESYEVKSEKISDDGKTATVEMTLKYGSGKQEDTTIELKKGEDGKWYISLGK